MRGLRHAHRYRVDVNQESVAQGMANVARACSGMPSRALRQLAERVGGAKTPVASLVTGGLVIGTLIVLAPLFSDLPKAVLARSSSTRSSSG